MKILMVLTSHDQLGDTGKKTGFWLDEFAAPYYVFKDAGADITLASPMGGQPPIDPASDGILQQSKATLRFKLDSEAKAQLAATHKLDTVKAEDYDALFFPGGHGPMWDLSANADSKALIEAFNAKGQPIGAVCHGPAAFHNAKKKDGTPFVAGRRIAGFTNGEEESVGLTKVVPFLLEDDLKAQGANYEKGKDFSEFVVTDRNLVTGQNPGSSAEAARQLLALAA